MFPLVETIKIIDGIPQNLRYHKFRFEKSYFLYYKSLNEKEFPIEFEIPVKYKTGKVKLRLLYNKQGFNFEYSLYQRKEIYNLKVVFDNNIEYPVKYTDRKAIDRLLKFRENKDDILIVKDGNVTDSSFANIVFFDGNKWYTPASPLLQGTTRERLIDKEIIIPAPIKYNDLKYFKKFKLINAMIDFEEALEIDIKNIY